LEHLEAIEVSEAPGEAFRLPVQLVLRADGGFRGYAGQIVSGLVRVGDPIAVWPSGQRTTVKRIVTWDGDLDSAAAPQSVTLVLSDDIDISRGDVIATHPPDVASRFEATVVWMDERPLEPSRLYLVKQTARTVTAEIDRPLTLNEIGDVTVKAGKPLVFDRYVRSRGTGSFIIIDPTTSFTAGAGMIVRASRESAEAFDRVSAAERLVNLARRAATHPDAVTAVSQALEEMLT
jgi:sulfate adenylyltransferase subunit 1 (EFTu-like GTPase family)